MISVFPSRGLYLTTIFYRDDNILVTSEDQIPIVEVEDSFSVSLMQDFLWFTKVDTRPYNHWCRMKVYIFYIGHNMMYYLAFTTDVICVNLIHVAGVLSVGGDSLAAAVSHFLPDFLFLYSADTSQDAPGSFPATGTPVPNHYRKFWHLC